MMAAGRADRRIPGIGRIGADLRRALSALGADHVVLIGRGRPWQPTDLDTIARIITQLTAG
jgi:hypothetical protein